MALLQANGDQRKQFSVLDVEGLTKAKDAVRKYLDELNAEKVQLAKRYDSEISNPKIILPTIPQDTTCVYHQYVIRSEQRDELIDYLNEREIGTIIHYPIPPHLAEGYAYLGHKKGDFPKTETLAAEVLSIPIYTGMTEEEQERVIQALNAF